MKPNLNSKFINATKWSTISEVIAKLAAPISSMALARLLAPEAFGVVATLNMVIAFAEIFTDAGFQRYLIQHEFVDEEDKDKSTNVAFWSNLLMSIILCGIIAIFKDDLATFVGSPGLGNVLLISCLSIPLAAFSSIQIALFRKDLDFKTLFWRRIAIIIIPLCVTIPLAVWLRSYWALIIGTLTTNLVNAVLLTVKSSWRPRLYFSFKRLQEMLSFCTWSVFDAILIWATSYIDIFFISRALDAYYLGIYRTSIATVGQFTSLITASVLPVVMPAISCLKNDLPEMRKTLLKFQKFTGIVLLPLGFGIFVFSDFITKVMLGNQWTEASAFIGLWALMEVITVIFARFCSNVYPAIGKPRISVFVQILHLIVLIPAVIISGKYGFTELYTTRSLVRMELVLVNFFAIYYTIRLKPINMVSNILPELLASSIMALIGMYLLTLSENMYMTIVWLVISILIYLICLWIIPSERAMLKNVGNFIMKKIQVK